MTNPVGGNSAGETTTAPSPDCTLEFWFDFASNYSYLSVMRIEEEASRYNVRVLWRPFLLGPIFRALGFDNSPFVLQREKGAYVQQDMTRECRKYGLPAWKAPAVFPRTGVLPARVALVGSVHSWIGSFCREVMQANFVHDKDINDAGTIKQILDRLDLSSASILEEARSEPARAALREQTEEARERGVFGAPTFFVGNEMFWGNDRLADALAGTGRLPAAQGRVTHGSTG